MSLPSGHRVFVQAARRDRTVLAQKLSRDTSKRIVRLARQQGLIIGFFLTVVVVEAALVVVNPFLVKSLIDDGILTANSSWILTLAVAMLLVSLTDAALGVLSGYLSSRIGETLIHRLRTAVFSHVQRLSLAFFTRTQTGALVSRLNHDVVGAQRAFTSTLSSAVSNMVSVLVVGVSMLILSWQVTLLCLALFPLLLVASRMVGARLSMLTRAQMDANAAMSNSMTERFSVGGALLLKLFGRRDEEDARYSLRAAEVRDLGIRISVITRIFRAIMLLVPAIATALVWGIGGIFVVNGSLTLGGLTALATLLLRLLGPLQGLSNVRVDLMTALVSFERVFEVLDLPSTVPEPAEPRPLPRNSNRISFEQVSFRYPTAAEVSLPSLEHITRQSPENTELVLRDLDLVIEPGQMVALVGPSGAGKTTLTGLVARLYDVTAGRVQIGTSEQMVDVREVSLQSLEQVLGYVTQDAHMFHDTIGENLRYARPAATDAQLWQALEDANIAELVRSMPQQLDTVVGDHGYRLSGGERQRLAIARVLLKQPPIVVLDEATAHLDSASEVAVQQALSRALAGRTSLVIAHRLSTIVEADLIVVLENGRIVEQGTHDNLITAGGLYAELARSQFGVTLPQGR